MPKLFKVETLVGNGWEDIWTIDDGKGAKPERFKSQTEAASAIHEHIRDCVVAVARGDMEDVPLESEFRIAPAGDSKHMRGGWSFYPIAPNAVGNFVEDLKQIQSLIGSAMYETKLRDGAYYVRRLW